MATLIEAAKTGNLTQVRRILCAGRTDINCRDSERKGTPLFWAANGGHDEIVALLLDNGANIEIPVKYGMTPLLAAVDRKHLTTTKLLLARGADVNAQSQNGDTALHLAAYRGSSHLCRLLLEFGASKTFLNNTGKTAQQGADAAGHESIFNLLAQETSHKAVCRSSSLPSAYQTDGPVEASWREPRVASESDDSPFFDNDEEWNSLQRKLSKPPLHHVMAIGRDVEVTRCYSAQQLDKVGRMSPPSNQHSVPHKKSPHHHLIDSSRPMRRGSNPEMQRECRGQGPCKHVGEAYFSRDLKQDRRWSPPLPRQHSEGAPVGQYHGFPVQRDGQLRFQESSGNGFSYKTNRQPTRQLPHHEHSIRRDISTGYNESLQNVDVTHRLSPETPRRNPEVRDVYHQQMGSSRRLGDEHIRHPGILSTAGSATANNGHSGPDNHVQWSPDILSGHRDHQKNSQGCFTISDHSNDQGSQRQRLLQDSGSAAVGYGQRTLGKNNLQNVERDIMDASGGDQNSEVRQLHSVIEKLLEDKLSLKEQNQMMGERMNRLELALDAALAADSSSEESLQTSSDSDLVQALAKKLDSNLGSGNLEQLCLKLLNDNQRLNALPVLPGRRDDYVIDSGENRGPQDYTIDGRNRPSTPSRNSDLKPESGNEYLSIRSPSERSTSSSSLSPSSESSSYDYGSGSDYGASSKKLSGDKESAQTERTSVKQPTLSMTFTRECWRSLNSSYPKVAFHSGNTASTATKVASPNRTENIKRVLQAMNENDKHLDSRGQYSTQLTDGGESESSQTVDILEKWGQTSGPGGNISAQFKCVMNDKLCILKVDNSKTFQQENNDAVEHVEETLSPSPHLLLPIHHWDVPLPGEGRFAQQLLMQLQANPSRSKESLPGSQETGHHPSKGGHGDVGLPQDAGYQPDKDVFRCLIYSSVKLTLEELFRWGIMNAEEEPTPCTDTGITRILLQLLLAVEHLHREGVVHGNIHPGCVYVTEDMRVVLGGLEKARRLDKRGGNTPLPEMASNIPEVTAGQSSDESGDTFAIAATLVKLLRSQGGSAELSNQQVTTPPDWLSRNLHNLLTEMLCSDPENRPPVKSALLRAAAMLYGPEPDEVKSEVDCEEWLISQALRLIITAPRDQSSLSPTGEQDLGDSISRLDWGLSRDFIMSVTPEQVWQLCQQHTKT
ncbi:uncharacterized protein LOC593232 [Strongylocentrotus purpuratus]|uniref:Protein kinase domain-containing protein n=1 Tax=Strongylocentrotus purpuratus TaxID=7668 RepID=A0A7M7RF53_STRPU|nr:uncharacterized protein LOC593232 [Strongylocentrotus purpuratus]